MSHHSANSGKDQYIHNDSSQRQDILNKCFRHTTADAFRKSGIVHASQTNATFCVLEIGCGSGATTLDLATILPNAVITAVDTDPTLIAAANERLEQASITSPELKNRITFHEKNGEEMGKLFPSHFDAVWFRMVLIHVPDHMALLSSAIESLKSGGTLLIEDCQSKGEINDPPWMANSWLHRTHEDASVLLGANVERGAKVGRFLESFGRTLTDVQVDTFVPLFAKGVKIAPWCRWSDGGGTSTTELGAYPNQEEHYELGMELIKGTLKSVTNKFLELGVATQRDIDLAWKSIEQVEDDSITSYQVFSFPGGTFFQWWARKT